MDDKIVDSKANKSSQQASKKMFLASTNSFNYHCCNKGRHNLVDCPEFVPKTPRQRFMYVKKNRICFCCFSSEHIAVHCQGEGCKKCGYKCNLMLHFEKDSPSASEPTFSSNSSS